MSLIHEAEIRVRTLLSELGESCVFHDYSHCEQVQEASLRLGRIEGCTAEELDILQIAALFHDTGYVDGAQNHELRGAENAQTFLNGCGAEKLIPTVRELILATDFNREPKTLLEMVLCDADLSYLGTDLYESRAELLRYEMRSMRAREFSEPDWLEFNLHFFRSHHFYSQSAKDLFQSKKKLNEREIELKIKRLNGISKA